MSESIKYCIADVTFLFRGFCILDKNLSYIYIQQAQEDYG